MIKLWAILKLVWIERMVYRVNFFLEILSGIVSSLIVVFLWIAIYRDAGRGCINGYSIEEMVTYLLGGGLINTFILTTAENPETSRSIQDGTLFANFAVKDMAIVDPPLEKIYKSIYLRSKYPGK